MISVWVYEQDKIVSLPQSRLYEPVRLPAQASGPIPLYRIAVLPREGERDAVRFSTVFPDEQLRTRKRNFPSPSERFPDIVPSLKAFSTPEPVCAAIAGYSRAAQKSLVQYGFFSSETLSLIRPLARRRFRMSLPPRVFIRARNPNLRFRFTLLG